MLRCWETSEGMIKLWLLRAQAHRAQQVRLFDLSEYNPAVEEYRYEMRTPLME